MLFCIVVAQKTKVFFTVVGFFLQSWEFLQGNKMSFSKLAGHKRCTFKCNLTDLNGHWGFVDCNNYNPPCGHWWMVGNVVYVCVLLLLVLQLLLLLFVGPSWDAVVVEWTS